jgi:hypothetical protein
MPTCDCKNVTNKGAKPLRPSCLLFLEKFTDEDAENKGREVVI